MAAVADKKAFDKCRPAAILRLFTVMDWKYKHFQQERVFQATREDVLAAAHAFMAGSLGWQVTDRADGLSAEGYSFTHHAIANLHIQSTAGGTKVAIELLVARAGWRGYMLFDVGGYYSIQMRKWLDGVQWALRQKLTGTPDQSSNPLVLAANKPSAHIFNGCLVFIFVIFGLYLAVTLVSAVVGLLTGTLFLLGRGTLIVHGVAARIVSALILLFAVFLAYRIKVTPTRRATPIVKPRP